jgi:ubiquinone biosynthesis protein UbiJ
MSLRDDARPPNAFEAASIAAVERAVNSALRSDPAAQAQLARHIGRLVAVHLTLPPLTVYALVVEDGLELYHTSDARPDIRLRGSAPELAAQLFNNDDGALIGSRVRIQGDQGLLQELAAIGRGLDVDWGALFEPLLGPELAQQVDYGARQFFGWARQAFTRFGEQMGEFLRDESQLLALRHDVYEFNQDVDELRMDLDRLDARVQRIRHRLDGEA